MSVLPPTKIEAKLVIDCTYYAALIDNICGDALLEAPPGVYASNRVDPVLVPGQTYFTHKGISTVPVTNINEATSSVYAEDGRCAVSSAMIKNKSRLLSNHPFMPYRGFKIIKLLVEDYLEKLAMYRRGRKDIAFELNKHFKQDIAFRIDYHELIAHECMDLLSDVQTFIGDYRWNIYHLSMKNAQLHLERDLDYRAHCWEIEHGESFRAGTYRCNA